MEIETRLEQILSKEKVVIDPEILERYSGSQIHGDVKKPFCIVQPTSTKEVQELVQWANETRVPLIPVSSHTSSQQPWTGNRIPLFGGVVVDMSRMNKILRIDRLNRVVMIEPGVTFAQLLPEMEKEDLRLLAPLCPPRSKSVISSNLDRIPMTIPRYHTDMSDPLLCMEVVFGTGDRFRTGEAAGPGSIEEQLEMKKVQKWDQGPGQIDIRRMVQGAQGSLGIVTWATLRAEVLPTLRKVLLFPLQGISDAIELVYQISRRKLGDECLILNNLNLASILDTGGNIDDLKESLPPWILLVGISGLKKFPEERVRYQEEDIIDIGGRLGLVPRKEVSGFKDTEFVRLLARPSEEPYWKLRYKGGFRDMFFLTTLDRVLHFVGLIAQVASNGGCSLADMGIYIQPIQQGRACHCEFTIVYHPESKTEFRRIDLFLRQISNAVMNEGGFFSIPSAIWAETSYNRDSATRNAIRKIKGIFDPNNIMNPGFAF
jgi:FAD/FMN-containing dehydrogenase